MEKDGSNAQRVKDLEPPHMARNEKAGNCWSQPRRSTAAKSRPSCSRGLRTDDIDSFGDIINAFGCGDRGGRNRRENWQVSRNVPGGCFSSSGCCLKNGRVQCSCLCPKNTYPEQQRKDSHRYPRTFNKNTLSFENKSSLWPDNNVSNGCFQDKMLEEFILDDNELSLLNYYEIPVDVPRRRHVRNVGKVKTVSIIDTLSELASGATDREDEGGFSSAVSESAIINRNVYKPRARHARPAIPRKDRTFRDNSIAANLTPKIVDNSTTHKSLINNALRTQGNEFNCQNFGDDGHFTCSSLKRTLKYLRKAVSTNVEEDARNQKHKHVRENGDEDEAFRLCFSDSEVKDKPEQWPLFKKEKLNFSTNAKSKSLLTVIDSFLDPVPKHSSLFRSRTKTAIPDWIQDVFSAAKKGDVEKMKHNLKDIDPALVRNLSDDHGNNLWHICAVHNNFECLNWLCSHNPHHTEALKDENKNGFTPVSLAVKHGSLLAVQWLIHNTVCKTELAPHNDSRSLLHVAARYGQVAVMEWFLNYMSTQDLDASIVDAEGNTALHLASKYGHIACVKALVFRIGCLKTRNEHGLKPLDLAVKHCKTDCADYLVALESCYNLAALNLRQHSEIQQVHKENAEVKSYFKELLALTKRLQNQQKELVQSFNRMKMVSQYERSSDKNQYVDDYSQLLTSVVTDEEHHLLLVEDRWKKSKKQIKYTDSKKKPLDVLRSQFSHVLEKVSCQSPPIPSTPETSDGSWQSDDDDPLPSNIQLPEFSAPDLVNSMSPQTSVPFLNSKRRNQKINPGRAFKDLEIKPESLDALSLPNANSPSKGMLNNRDVNLRMFFKQNPNLRQSGETCSVLEVLEPSSSDSEECSNKKKRLSKMCNSEKETEQSSSSSALETLSPYSCRPSSSGSKASGSRSSSNGSRKNPFPPVSDGSYNQNLHATSEKSKQPENEAGNSSREMGDKGTNEQLNSNISSEPDLIKGTQKKKLPSSTEKERKSKDFPFDNIDNPSLSAEDSESLEADQSFSSTTDVPEGSVPSNADISNASTTIKKKSFLLKFALRGRWPSKAAPRSLKNEISPEEFRETYSRTTSVDSVPTSQIVVSPDSSSKKSISPLKTDSEILSSEPLDQETSTNNERLTDGSGMFSLPPVTDAMNQTLMRNRRGLLPPRRDPPPAPPINIRDDEQSQDHSDDDMSVSIQKSSLSSCAEDCLTSSVSLHNSYLGSRSSDLWHSPDSKSLFRPASSASRVGSLSRGEENFSLNKSSSASTEMLSALDTSTAGRQSPAPSEVSKTESALSPPSDVSKTESTRYLSQLGKIEESGHLTTINVSNLEHNDEQNIKENTLTKETKSEIKHKKKSGKKLNSDKPWYEFSDEEDVIVPQRYQTVSVSMRSSSDDE